MSEEPNPLPGFSPDLPSIQNAISIFGNWNSALPIPGVEAGGVGLFSAERDPRPSFAREVFGPLDRFDILELGSFEGGHSYQLEKLGAKSVLGIEASTESFLKSLVIKETLGLKARFLYGDFKKISGNHTTKIRPDICCWGFISYDGPASPPASDC